MANTKTKKNTNKSSNKSKKNAKADKPTKTDKSLKANKSKQVKSKSTKKQESSKSTKKVLTQEETVPNTDKKSEFANIDINDIPEDYKKELENHILTSHGKMSRLIKEHYKKKGLTAPSSVKSDEDDTDDAKNKKKVPIDEVIPNLSGAHVAVCALLETLCEEIFKNVIRFVNINKVGVKSAHRKVVKESIIYSPIFSEYFTINMIEKYDPTTEYKPPLFRKIMEKIRDRTDNKLSITSKSWLFIDYLLAKVYGDILETARKLMIFKKARGISHENIKCAVEIKFNGHLRASIIANIESAIKCYEKIQSLTKIKRVKKEESKDESKNDSKDSSKSKAKKSKSNIDDIENESDNESDDDVSDDDVSDDDSNDVSDDDSGDDSDDDSDDGNGYIDESSDESSEENNDLDDLDDGSDSDDDLDDLDDNVDIEAKK